MFLSDMSLSSLSLLSSKNGAVALLHSSPLHPSQAATHFKPLFRQEHRLVPQTLRDDNLHLHRIITKRLSGAASLSVITGNNILFIFFHPQSSGFSIHLSKDFHTNLKMYTQTVEIGSSFSWWQSLWINLHCICCYHTHIFFIAQTI